MDTCFLFTEHLTEAGCVLLKLTSDAQLLVPPSHLSFKEILVLQQNSKTIVIESSANTSILSLELSWLPERKARIAIPFALEENLAQPINSLHFAFDKERYQNNRYLVVVISTERMQFIMWLLEKEDIQFDLITTDWFALAPLEYVISGSTLLIHHSDFNGALSGDLAVNYLNTHPLHQALSFQDSQIEADVEFDKQDEHSFLWIAKRIAKSRPLNLCQGQMQHGNETGALKKRLYLAGSLCCLWLLSILLINGIKLHALNNKTAQIDEQIALIYHEFFPNASQVISPKFRIQQLLSANEQSNDKHFWFLLNQLAKSMLNNPLKIEQLRFQNQSLSATFISPDFASIERLKNKMKENQLQVKQSQASTRDQQVVATLEFT